MQVERTGSKAHLALGPRQISQTEKKEKKNPRLVKEADGSMRESFSIPNQTMGAVAEGRHDGRESAGKRGYEEGGEYLVLKERPKLLVGELDET